jgi:hypothetical protein
MTPPEFPRPLSDREAAILDFMLSPDDARLHPLREQASRATVIGRWDCCATIELSVDPATPGTSEGPSNLVVEATTLSWGNADTSFELLLFEKGGRAPYVGAGPLRRAATYGVPAG